MRRKPDQLIPLEIAILEAALRLHRRGSPAFYGYLLARSIETPSGDPVQAGQGTLYRALHRLENARLLDSFWEDGAEAEREGRPRRRMYRLTPEAEPVLSRARAQQRAAAKLRRLEEDLGTT